MAQNSWTICMHEAIIATALYTQYYSIAMYSNCINQLIFGMVVNCVKSGGKYWHVALLHCDNGLLTHQKQVYVPSVVPHTA